MQSHPLFLTVDAPQTPSPSAVNNTPLRTYGKWSLTLNLGLRRPLPWIFIVADVQKPIIGADFLRHFGLLVDIKEHQLIDATTRLHIQGILSTDPSPIPSICPKDTSQKTSGSLQPIHVPAKLWCQVGMDLVGPFPETLQGNPP